MPNNDPLKSVENIVQLQSARRTAAVTPALQVPRAQPMPPVMFASWVAARDRVAASLLGGTTRLALTGPAGTGKTVLIEQVARVLRAAGRTVNVQLADAEPTPPGPGVTLFVDEADRLSAAKLRELFQGATGTLVVTGLSPLVRRVPAGTVQLKLEPLDPSEAQEYIAQWLALHERTPAELDSKAVRSLIELSGGVPRLLSTLLAAGAWLSESSNANIIDASHIQEAAELRSVLGPTTKPESSDLTPAPARRGRLMWSGLLAGVVLGGTAAAVVPRLFPAETDRAIARAAPFVDRAARWLRAEPRTPFRAEPPAAEGPAPIGAPVLTEASPPASPLESTRVAEPPRPPEPAATAADPTPSEPAVEHTEAAPEQTATAPVPPQPAPEPAQATLNAPSSTPIQEPATAEAAPPTGTALAMATPPAPPAPAPVVAPPADLPADTIDLLLRRGRQMLALGDISAARLLLLRAAEAGSPEAMFQLGQTYDTAVLTTLGATRQADQQEALRWYRRAAAKGQPAAEQILQKP